MSGGKKKLEAQCLIRNEPFPPVTPNNSNGKVRGKAKDRFLIIGDLEEHDYPLLTHNLTG